MEGPPENESTKAGRSQVSDAVKLFLIGVFAIISLLVTFYAVTEQGEGAFIENYYLIPHLYIIPIILVSLWYPRRGGHVIILLIASIIALTGFMYLIRHTGDPILSLLNAGVDVWIVAALALTVRSRVINTGGISAPAHERTSDEDPSLQVSAGISASPDQASPDQISGYMEALKLSDEGIRQEALRALAHFEDPRALEALVAALQDQSRSIRIEAIRSLGKIALPETIPPLLLMFKDENRMVREAAVKALAGKGGVVVEPLIRALVDSDWHVRMGATIGLRIIGDERAIDPLIQRLEDENRFVRREVVKSLGRFGDERAQNRLMDLREDPDQTVRLRAEVALMKIHGRQFEGDALNIPIDMKEID
jgi:hypothetical protein